MGLRLYIGVRALAVPTAFGVVGLVQDSQGRVLLVRHTYLAGWSLPGGGVNRGEPPGTAILRELAEEVGLSGGTAVLRGLYSRPLGWITNVIALYHITGAVPDFRPNREIAEICFADPAAPPPGTTPATLKRLAELTGAAAISAFW